MFDPHAEQTPYDFLGLAPDASAVEIRDRFNELQRDIQESGLSVSERAKRKEQLENAYNQLRVSSQRVKVDFWILDSRIGSKQCESIADSVAKPQTEIKGLIKPKTIRVTHDAMLGEPPRFVDKPERVVGLHAQPMDVAEPAMLPAPLEIQFDC